MVDKKGVNIKKQFITTLLTFFFTFLLPLLSYTQLLPIFDKAEELLYLRSYIIFNSVLAILIGGILTGLRYVVFYFKKRSLKRAFINLISTLLVMILLGSSAQLGVIKVDIDESYVFLDIRSVFALLIFSWALIVFKAVYDLVEIKFFPGAAILLTAREKMRRKGLIKCPSCKYMCRKEWKKCPICKSVLH